MGGGDSLAGGHGMITAVIPVYTDGGGRFRMCMQHARGLRRLGFTFGAQPGIDRIAHYWGARYLRRIA